MEKYRRVVIKVGTKVIASKDKGLDAACMGAIASQIAILTQGGTGVILVTSGAIGAGMSLLNMKKRPSELGLLQAAAAVGQSRLMHLYGELFKPFDFNVGQVLLTQEDFREKSVRVSVRFGKWLKNETFMLVKFTSLFSFLLARFFTSCLILSWKKKGAMIRINKRANRMPPKILIAFFMADYFNTFS